MVEGEHAGFSARQPFAQPIMREGEGDPKAGAIEIPIGSRQVPELFQFVGREVAFQDRPDEVAQPLPILAVERRDDIERRGFPGAVKDQDVLMEAAAEPQEFRRGGKRPSRFLVRFGRFRFFVLCPIAAARIIDRPDPWIGIWAGP
ncbi:hypothetical protein [Methylobacterium gregans]|uniref:hypothetical protein n=1 Tax=Methylobacterium gregans TaxID=374424 RepID=UPI00361B74EC